MPHNQDHGDCTQDNEDKKLEEAYKRLEAEIKAHEREMARWEEERRLENEYYTRKAQDMRKNIRERYVGV
jgi:hypothetical protein